MIADENGLTLHPIQFAKMLADTNFAHQKFMQRSSAPKSSLRGSG